MALKIGGGDAERIHEHALEAYPEECAGALVGIDAGGTKVVVDVWRAETSGSSDSLTTTATLPAAPSTRAE